MGGTKTDDSFHRLSASPGFGSERLNGSPEARQNRAIPAMEGRVKRLLVVGVLVSCLATASAAQNTPAAPPADLDAWVARAMAEFHTPGVAMAIVKDSRVLFSKGFGVRRLGSPEKVDEDTLFGIASNTKAFTAAALAMLVDEGKIKWDDRVIDHLPSFRMSDPYVTREITVRDLLTHRSGMGLGAGDLMFFPDSDFTREQIVFNQRYIPLATSFRSAYAYDNVLYLVAGQIIPAVTGKTWDDFIRERIFDVVGMMHSDTTVTALVPGVNYATPHYTVDGTLRPVKNDHLDNTAPAGAINSCVSDLAKWVIVRLDEGALPNGKRLFSKSRASEMWSGQTILPIRDLPDPLAALKPRFSLYGLGLHLRDYHGRKLVLHDGGLTGYLSQVVMVPEERLGIVVLTNGDADEAVSSITWHVLDHFLAVAPTDWIDAYNNVKAKREKAAEEVVQKAQAARNQDSKPSLTSAKCAGTYRDAWYGDATMTVEDGKLRMRFSHSPGLDGSLDHFQYDTFIARWRDRTVPDAYVTFSLQADGSIRDIRLKAVSPLADFSYDFQDLLFTPVPTAP
jgi:CubicO group peptidase (beta-lactamase class C family)